MKVFIDFDDVIFNTKRFRENLEIVFDKNGISREIFQKYYIDPNDQRAIKTFNPWLQIDRIGKELNIDVEKINAAIDEFIVDISRFVFSDVEEFVTHFKAEDIFIVSYGDLEFQRRKIVGSKIDEYFKNVIITSSLKSLAIENVLQKKCCKENEQLFFLDDRVEQIEDVKAKFPGINTILIKRPEGRYQEMMQKQYCDHEAHDLVEALIIIKNIKK